MRLNRPSLLRTRRRWHRREANFHKQSGDIRTVSQQHRMRHRGFRRRGKFTVHKLTPESCDQTGQTVEINMSWNIKKINLKKPVKETLQPFLHLFYGTCEKEDLQIATFGCNMVLFHIDGTFYSDGMLQMTPTRFKINIYLELQWLLWTAATSVLVWSTLLKLYLHLTGAIF